MKRLLVIVLIISACGGSEVVEEPVTTTTILDESTNTTTSTTVQENQKDTKDFYTIWESNLKDKILLSNKEAEVTESFYELWYSKGSPSEIKNENFYEIQVDGRSCFRLGGSAPTSYLDEKHPMAGFNDYLINSKYSYAAKQSYECTSSEEERVNHYFTGIYLYGVPFYYEDTWWIYQSVPLSSVELHNSIEGTNRPSWDYATRIKIEYNDELSLATKTLNPASLLNCDPDPTVPECLYEYNSTSELFWSGASVFYAHQYEKLWNLYVERYRNQDIETPPEIANIFDQPVFTIEVDGKRLNCFYHMPHNSQYWRTEGIYPQPVETVTEDENYLVWPKIYWDCLDVPLSLRYGNYSTDDNWNLVNTDVMYFGQGPIVLLGDIGNRDPNFRYGTWIMWGPEQPFGENSSDKPRQFEVRDKYWWYEDGFSVESFCEETTFTYQEDYEILCINEDN